MKQILKLISAATALLIVVLAFTACVSVYHERYHYLADFYSGVSFEDYGNLYNLLDSDFRFGQGDKKLKFHAEFRDDRILYTVVDITEDRISEKKTFSEIYSLYYDNWEEYNRKVLQGNGVSTEISDDGEIETITLYISGDKYTAEFAPSEPTPYIEIRRTEIA